MMCGVKHSKCVATTILPSDESSGIRQVHRHLGIIRGQYGDWFRSGFITGSWYDQSQTFTYGTCPTLILPLTSTTYKTRQRTLKRHVHQTSRNLTHRIKRANHTTSMLPRHHRSQRGLRCASMSFGAEDLHDFENHESGKNGQCYDGTCGKVWQICEECQI